MFGLSQTSDTYALHRILQRYTETYGGVRDADTLSSLSVEGTIEQNGGSFDFSIWKKRPYFMRYHLASEDNQVITAYNGDMGWIRIETNGATTISEIASSDLRALRKKARFDSPLFRHLEQRENTLTLLKRVTEEEQDLYLIEVRHMSDPPEHFYLDSATALLVRHDILDESGTIVFQTFYRDYREVGGFPIAHEIESRAGSKQVAFARVETVVINPGILSFYFEKPNR
jgi:hypothetical protein